jgi:hypothetical protein
MRRLSNPTLRRYYGEVLGHSLESNSSGMIRSLQKFDLEAKRQEEKATQ